MSSTPPVNPTISEEQMLRNYGFPEIEVVIVGDIDSQSTNKRPAALAEETVPPPKDTAKIVAAPVPSPIPTSSSDRYPMRNREKRPAPSRLPSSSASSATPKKRGKAKQQTSTVKKLPNARHLPMKPSEAIKQRQDELANILLKYDVDIRTVGLEFSSTIPGKSSSVTKSRQAQSECDAVFQKCVDFSQKYRLEPLSEHSIPEERKKKPMVADECFQPIDGCGISIVNTCDNTDPSAAELLAPLNGDDLVNVIQRLLATDPALPIWAKSIIPYLVGKVNELEKRVASAEGKAVSSE